MKTTIDIADPLFKRIKRLAARRGTTMRAIIEEALRKALAEEGRQRRIGRLKTHTFGGKGLQPGLSWGDWAAVRDLAYEGRGG